MPNRRITIILNANQAKRITVLIPLPRAGDEDYNLKELILTQARNKFHSKYLSIVYRWGGETLEDGGDLPEKEEEVLVSKGELYIGPPKKPTRSDGRRGVVRVIAEESFVHEEAVKQLEAVAEFEGVHACIGLPDLHKGDRFPIGCSILSSGVYPALIGSDIGCGISLYPLGSTPRNITPQKIASKLKGLDQPWDGDVKEWLKLYGVESGEELEEFDSSLGTVGGGNHFAEIVTVERTVDNEACDSMGLQENHLYLLVHTGSRGLGASILRRYTHSGISNPYFPPNHPELEEYLRKHDRAVVWAKANRDLVAHRIKNCLFPRGYVDELEEEVDGDLSVTTSSVDPASTVDPRDGLEKILDVTHNSVTQVGWEVDGNMETCWLHRKGAAPTDKGFVPCPGSRGDFSWILQPMGDGVHNGHSLAHGAGRLHPRSAPSLRKGHPSDLTTTSFGSYVICTDPELLVQERPEAYKSVQAVVDDLEGTGVAEGVCVLKPVVTFKTGEEKRK